MQYRINNKNGDKLSVLGFGCMRFPQKLGRIDMDKTEQIILNAVKDGVNFFDTAFIYNGSETALGIITDKNKIRDKIFISTKLPAYLCKSYADFDKYLNIQLSRLKTDYIDYYFMHMLTSISDFEKLKNLGIEKWIEEKKTAGIIRNAGFSFHGQKDDFFKIIDAYDWNFCMIQYNYMNTHYQAGTEGLKYAALKGLPVFIMEPLLGGKLANGLPEKAVKVFSDTNSKYTPAAWALRWLWNKPEVTLILSGMNEQSQLDENIALATESYPEMLTESELKAYDEVADVFSESYKVKCTGCGYCMPCPKNVDIPACFTAYNTSFAMSKSKGRSMYMTGAAIASPNQKLASQCIKCGKCEGHCPQKIAIRKELADVEKRLEPIWLKAGAFFCRIFFKR